MSKLKTRMNLFFQVINGMLPLYSNLSTQKKHFKIISGFMIFFYNSKATSIYILTKKKIKFSKDNSYS